MNTSVDPEGPPLAVLERLLLESGRPLRSVTSVQRFERALEHLGAPTVAGVNRSFDFRSVADLLSLVRLGLYEDVIGNSRHVLDVGCGIGWPSFALERPGRTLTGVDASQEMISIAARVAAERGSRIDLVRGAGEKLPFPSASFDAVVSEGTLDACSQPARFLEEAQRVLRPGGKLACLTSNWSYWMAAHPLLEQGYFSCANGNKCFIYTVWRADPPGEREYIFLLDPLSAIARDLEGVSVGELENLEWDYVSHSKEILASSYSVLFFESPQLDVVAAGRALTVAGFAEVAVHGLNSGDTERLRALAGRAGALSEPEIRLECRALATSVLGRRSRSIDSDLLLVARK